MKLSIPPPSLLHISPTKNRRSIRRRGLLLPAFQPKACRCIWTCEAVVVSNVYQHLRYLREAVRYDVWLVLTKGSESWTRYRPHIWRSWEPLSSMKVMIIGEMLPFSREVSCKLVRA